MTKLMFHFSPLLTRKKWSLKTFKKNKQKSRSEWKTKDEMGREMNGIRNNYKDRKWSSQITVLFGGTKINMYENWGSDAKKQIGLNFQVGDLFLLI